MTEPEHIPLTARWNDKAVEKLVRWLQGADDAHEVDFEEED